MPRNQTTGVFTRVSNSFSDPVYGTVIDPTDAIALFDDQDVGMTFDDTSPLILIGSTSGVLKVQAPDTASGVITLPAGTTDFSATGGTGQFVRQDSAGAAFTVTTVPASSVSSGAALTKSDDTNVTLALGGSPTTALLAATSLTLGWTGQLSLTRGGTNASLTASDGGVFYSTASGGAILAGTANPNRPLISGTSSAPSWAAISYPSSATSGGIPYFSSTSQITSSAALAANQIVIGGGAGTSPATLGSLGSTTTVLHGNAGGAPTFAAVSLTADITGTLGVPNGGTGNTTFTAYGVICAGTTATGAFQNVVGLGTSGQVLTSAGAGALPTWTSVSGTGTVTSVAAGTGMSFSTITTTGSVAIDKSSDANVYAAVSNKVFTSDLIESASALVALSDAATVAVDWDTGINYSLTVTASRIIGNPTNGQPGTYRTILVQGNDGTLRTITFGNQYLGTVPTITDCTSSKWYLLTIRCITTTHFVVSSQVAKT